MECPPTLLAAHVFLGLHYDYSLRYLYFGFFGSHPATFRGDSRLCAQGQSLVSAPSRGPWERPRWPSDYLLGPSLPRAQKQTLLSGGRFSEFTNHPLWLEKWEEAKGLQDSDRKAKFFSSFPSFPENILVPVGDFLCLLLLALLLFCFGCKS